MPRPWWGTGFQAGQSETHRSGANLPKALSNPVQPALQGFQGWADKNLSIGQRDAAGCPTLLSRYILILSRQFVLRLLTFCTRS
jgi:hypothetical protein